MSIEDMVDDQLCATENESVPVGLMTDVPDLTACGVCGHTHEACA